MRYRIFLTIKLLISRHVFLRGGEVIGIAVYIYVYLLLFTWLTEMTVHMFFRA